MNKLFIFTSNKRCRYGSLKRDREETLKLRSTDEYKNKLAATQLGEKNNAAKLTETDVLEIRAEYEKMLKHESVFRNKTKLAEHYGVKRPTVNDILFRRTWKHI